MTFVTERIPDSDLHRIDGEALLKRCSIRRMSDKFVEWTIDRERNAYLVPLGGGLGEIPGVFGLVWNDAIISFQAVRELKLGMDKSGKEIVLIWNIPTIVLPKSLHTQKDAIKQLIIDALDAYGLLSDRKGVDSVVINFAPECRYVFLENSGIAS